MKDISELIRKLQRLASDQKGTPEGDLAESMIEKLKEKYPDLNIEDKQLIQWQNKFKHEFEFHLWVMASRAHSIKLLKYNSEDVFELISEGDEVDMLLAKMEWDFASKQFTGMAEQVLRGIVNKIWPHICVNPEQIDGYEESPYREFADQARDMTVTPKKAITEKTA